MATAIATLHQVWDCRWSRPGHRLTGVAEADQPENTWVCVREGHRRNVTEAECGTCAHWEGVAGAEPALSVMTMPAAVTRGITQQVLTISARAVMLLNALIFAALGVVTLASPLAVPFTVTLWLCAAVFAGLVAFWRPE